MTTVVCKLYAYLDGSWTDLSSYVLGNGIRASWGMRGNKPLDILAETGTMSFSLKNADGRFTPRGASIISNDWDKGAKIKCVFTYDSNDYVRFYGWVDKIRIYPNTKGERKVDVDVVDWMSHAVRYPIQNPAIGRNQRADEAIATLLEGMPVQPTATILDTGVNVFPTVFNDAILQTKAYSEFQKISLSEFGRIYHLKDKLYGDTLRFEAANARTYSYPIKKVVVSSTPGHLLKEDGGALLQENGSYILTEAYTNQNVSIDNTMMDMDVVYGENVINRVTVTANVTKISQNDTQIFSLDSALQVPAYSDKSFFVQFTEENSKRLVAALAPDSSYPTTLLHFDAPGSEKLIIDEAGKPFSDFDVEIVTNVKKIGVGSLYFDGTGSYVLGSSSDDYELTGDFTIEYWEYRFSSTANCATISRTDTGGYVPWSIGYSDGTNSLIYITSNGSSWDIANGRTFGAISLNTWTHYAICRNGNNFYAYRDGTLTDSWTSSGTVLSSTSPITIGKSGSNYITACIDEVRITKGFARYTTDFSPSTDPYKLSGIVYAAWTNSNGSGTELTKYFTIDVEYGAAGAQVTVTNGGSTPGYITTLKINGKVVESVSPVTDIQENTASINQYGYQELNIDQKYKQDFQAGKEKGAEILDAERLSRVEVNRVTMNANRDEASMAYFLNTDVGDLVEIIEDQSEVNSSQFINSMGWEAIPGNNGAVVYYWWNVRKFRDGLTPIAVQFADLTTNYNQIDYGSLPAIQVEAVPYRFWSFWFKLGVMGQTGDFFSTLTGVGASDMKGYRIAMITATRKPGFVGVPYGGSQYNEWRFSAISNSPNTWFHMLFAYDARSSLNVPKLYVNGVANTLDATTAAYLTTISGEVGTNLRVDSLSDTAGDALQLLTMKDLRIYNGDQAGDPALLASQLYAEGAYGNNFKTGLLFRGFNAPIPELAEYTGAYLTEEQKVVDDIGFAVGTPKNSPLGTAV